MDIDSPQSEYGPERRAPRAELSQRHLETIFNAMHDAVLILDGETQQVLHANQTVGRVLGYAPGELAGSPFDRLSVEADSNTLEEAVLVDGVYGPVRLRCADGSTLKVDVTVAVIPWDGIPALLYSLRDVTQRTQQEEERANLIRELQEALLTVKQLSGLLPICANCKRIRDDDGTWPTLEKYISEHSDAEFSHGICPDCRELLYPELSRGKDPDRATS